MKTSSPIKKNNTNKTFLNSNKNLEINMSTLSTAQKQLCIKLLAESNINFQQGKDGFQAQLRINPDKLTSQFCAQKQKQKQKQRQTSPKLSPIKKRQNIPTNRKIQKNQKQNIKPKQIQAKKSIQNVKAKQIVHPIYASSKKSLSKTVKLNSLANLQALHPFVQLYVYPKKMSFQSLVQLIEQIYDHYWKQQINSKKNKHQNQNKALHHQKHIINANTTLSQSNSKFDKKATQNTQDKYKIQQFNQQQTIPNKSSFCSWIYKHFILAQKQKMKIQQLLVNFVQSLNHFSYKHLGIQIFYNLFAGIYNIETLNYFLVIRTLLQQVYQQKIIDKVSNFGSKAGILYKMKLNPYQKFIQQEKIYDFLEVCCCSQDNKSIQQDQYAKKIFQQMTQHMFFDQKKKKNFIHFHQMVEILLKEFSKVETVNTTNLELSFTGQNQTLDNFLFESQQQAIFQSIHPDQELQVTFEVKENHINFKDQSQSNILNNYLPSNNTYQQIQLPTNQLDNTFQEQFYQQIMKKYENVKVSFSGNNIVNHHDQNPQSLLILNTLYETITKMDKKKWVQFLKEKKIGNQKLTQELLFIEKLQMEFIQLKNSNIVSNQFIKKMFTASYLREAVVKEAAVSF